MHRDEPEAAWNGRPEDRDNAAVIARYDAVSVVVQRAESTDDIRYYHLICRGRSACAGDELGLTATVGLIHNGHGRLMPLTPEQQRVYSEIPR